MQSALTIFLHSARYDRVFQAVNLLETACSMEWRGNLFLFYEALASFMTGGWDEIDLVSGPGEARAPGLPATDPGGSPLYLLQRGFELSNAPSPYETLELARAGGCVVCACSASVKLLGLDPREVKARLDEIVGLPTMLQIAGKSTHSFYL
jgi:peroxiredoxin family protein